MNSVVRTLLWSEWRQRRQQFIVGMLWMVAAAAYCVIYELAVGYRAPVASYFSATSLFALAMPIFVAMRTSLGEFTDRTRAFHDGLPVSTRVRAVVRLLGGLTVLVVPIVSAAILLSCCLATGWIEQALERAADYNTNYFRLPDRPSQDALSAIAMAWRMAAIVAASATTLYLLLSLVGTALRNESHLGYVGAAVAAIWFLGSGMAESQTDATGTSWIGAILPQALAINYGYGTEDGSYGDLVIATRVAGPLLAGCVVQLGLAAFFVRRYSHRISRRTADKRRDALPQVWRRWALPLPTRGLALTWLTLRQTVAMCLPGLVIACLMAPLQMDAAEFDSSSSMVRRLTDILPSSMWVIGLLWSVVVGAGIFAPELDWRIAEFWRAWPTNVGRLFGVKFLVGLLVVLLVLDGSTIAVSWNSPNWGHYYFMNWPYIACIVPLHATMFSVAVAWACLLRRPVVGGMMALATFTVVMTALDWSNATRQFSPIDVYNNLNRENRNVGVAPSAIDFSAHNYPATISAMALLTIGMAIAGWWALRSYSPRRAPA